MVGNEQVDNQQILTSRDLWFFGYSLQVGNNQSFHFNFLRFRIFQFIDWNMKFYVLILISQF